MLPLPANLAVFIKTARGDTLQDGSSFQTNNQQKGKT
jgi:hypothetical protein